MHKGNPFTRLSRRLKIMLAACLILLGSILVFAAPASAGPSSWDYGTGYSSQCHHFNAGDCNWFTTEYPTYLFRMDSANGADRLAFQGDGNFVGYNNPGTTHWFNAGTACGTGACGFRLDLQKDCNVVVYNPDGQAVWSAHANSGNIVWSHCRLTLNGANQATVTIFPPGGTPFISSYFAPDQCGRLGC